MNNDFTVLATAFGATGTGMTYWLTQVNPFLAFISGILTIIFMSMGIYKRIRENQAQTRKSQKNGLPKRKSVDHTSK